MQRVQDLHLSSRPTHPPSETFVVGLIVLIFIFRVFRFFESRTLSKPGAVDPDHGQSIEGVVRVHVYLYERKTCCVRVE